MDPTLASQLDELARFPDLLKQQLAGLSDDLLRYRPAQGEWSIVEIIGHMTDVDAIWPARVRQMLATDNPQLSQADNALVTQRDYQNKQLGFLLMTLAERRAEFVELIKGLRPAQLERPGQHPTRGPITVAGAADALSKHDRAHHEQIRANIAAFDASRQKG